ncbi:hypothetical protein G8A07_05540 [Roseateles sp. DAIF2]|uniref:hypothetical protein n=1 Tax=Roseateles sp. DAIF2 TaxID=2714952 RepID=UPI0018A2F664|nr:hypothetical protein G8A07_05540 [Roseateles sp. DAIF2]
MSIARPPRLRASLSPLLLLLALGLSACGKQGVELGQGGSVVSGSAGPQGASNHARELQKCEAPIAVVALQENQGGQGLLTPRQ